jgi:hypothetical protein
VHEIKVKILLNVVSISFGLMSIALNLQSIYLFVAVVLRAILFGIVPWHTCDFRKFSIFVRAACPTCLVGFAFFNLQATKGTDDTTKNTLTELFQVLSIMCYNVGYGLRDFSASKTKFCVHVGRDS